MFPRRCGRQLDRYQTKRSKSEYGQSVEASEAEARDLLKLATELQERTPRWLKTHRRGMAGSDPAVTTLGALKVGARVNLEVDLVARSVARLHESS